MYIYTPLIICPTYLVNLFDNIRVLYGEMASQVRDAVDNNIEQVKVGSAAAVAAPTSSFEMDGSKRTDAGALFVLKSKGN